MEARTLNLPQSSVRRTNAIKEQGVNGDLTKRADVSDTIPNVSNENSATSLNDRFSADKEKTALSSGKKCGISRRVLEKLMTQLPEELLAQSLRTTSEL